FRDKRNWSVRFQNSDGTTFLLQEVRYMPDISRNLISMGVLEEKGCEFKAAKGVLKVVKGRTIFMKGLRRQSLYILQAKARISSTHVGETSSVTPEVKKADETQLLNNILGHLGQKGIDVLM